MNSTKFLPEREIASIVKAYQDLNSLLKDQTTTLGKIKKIKVRRFGIHITKVTGEGNQKIIFTLQSRSSKTSDTLYIDLENKNVEKAMKLSLIEIMLTKKNIFFTFDNFKSYSQVNLRLLEKYFNQIHPEALVLAPICFGKGIDVGCGFRKTHPGSIGIDWIDKGKKGLAGNVKGKISEADIVAKGNHLVMFNDNSLDYIVSRHNLEHYSNPEETLAEWIRVLKPGGKLGIVVPSGNNPDTDEETHYYSFTLGNFRKMLIKTKQIRILKIEECIPGWSFYCIASKIS